MLGQFSYRRCLNLMLLLLGGDVQPFQSVFEIKGLRFFQGIQDLFGVVYQILLVAGAVDHVGYVFEQLVGIFDLQLVR